MDSKTNELSRQAFALRDVPGSSAKKHAGLHCLSAIYGVIDTIESFNATFPGHNFWTLVASSRKRHNALASRICLGVRQSGSNNLELPTTMTAV